LPIDAEWLESQGWKSDFDEDGREFWYETKKAACIYWFPGFAVTVGGEATTIEARGELKTFLGFFGDAV